jgi:hypothetical protein
MKNELKRLANMLEEKGIEYDLKSCVNGEKNGMNIKLENTSISAISHEYSYGGKDGLIEVMSDVLPYDVEGHLYAEQVIQLIDVYDELLAYKAVVDKKRENLSNVYKKHIQEVLKKED